MPYKDKAQDAASKMAAAKRARESIRRLKDVPCLDCGRRYHHSQMEFDHSRGVKSFNIAASGGSTLKSERLQRELSKVDIVCANCHALRTFCRANPAEC